MSGDASYPSGVVCGAARCSAQMPVTAAWYLIRSDERITFLSAMQAIFSARHYDIRVAMSGFYTSYPSGVVPDTHKMDENAYHQIATSIVSLRKSLITGTFPFFRVGKKTIQTL
jgi:hypothetical protein